MSTFGGMEWWNGIVEWTTGMVECFIGHTYNHPACVVQWVNSELYAVFFACTAGWNGWLARLVLHCMNFEL